MNIDNLISIILPVYNAEKYIERALKSLINQSYKNIEILCIDDGSKDNSYNIIKEFKDERIKLFRQENSGPAKARNVGLSNSKGECIMFCDADDWYEPNMCELMLETLINQNVDFVLCDCNIIDHYNEKLRKPIELSYYKLKYKGYNILGRDEILGCNSMLWNKIYKKYIIQKGNIKFLNGYEHDDPNFVLKYLYNCYSYYGLEEKLYNYEVININSVMANYFLKRNEEKMLDFIYAYNDVVDYVIKNNFREQIQYCIIIQHYNTICNFQRYLNKYQKIKLIEIQKDFFKNLSQFDKFWYVNFIKNKSIDEILKLFKIKLTPLEWIFSLKNKNEHEKLVTIFGFQLTFKRHNFN